MYVLFSFSLLLFSLSGLCVSPNNLTEPTVIFVIGANGMGKTTTIGKIAGG